jgi:NAD(P)-dependent dehydrogenase (short-subunit alcohol dehydrogenase family)
MSRVVIITGASAGIGRAAADQLSALGWTVIGASRRGIAGDSWQGMAMDVDEDASVSSGIDRVLAEHGRIDALVAAAGWGLAGPVETTSIAEAKSQLETNFWGVVRPTAAVLPHFRAAGGGRVVILSSIGGLIGLPFQAYYSASKFALEGWAEALAYEVAPFGVHVTLVEPGNFATDFTSSRRRTEANDDDYRQAAERAVGAMERDERNGADPHSVALLIAAQLDAGRPRRRVSVGRSGERAGLVVKRLLPYRLFEAAARGSLGV